MKAKWTTITEDESTWPNEKKYIIINNGKKSCQGSWWTRYHDDMIMELYCNKYIKFPNEAIGWKWRPMPKPPKNKSGSDNKRPCGYKQPCGSCGSIEYSLACFGDYLGYSYCNLCSTLPRFTSKCKKCVCYV